MSARWKERCVIEPAAPEATIRRLLALPAAYILPLPAGSEDGICGCMEGEYFLAAAAQGSLTLASAAQYALLDAGQAVCIRGGSACSLEAVSDCLCFALRLTGTLAEELLADRVEDGIARFPGGAAVVREAVTTLSVHQEEHPPVSGAMASSMAYGLLMKLRSLPANAQQTGASSPLVESALAIIREEFPFLEGLDDLAERLEVSKAHLSRSFVRKTGISPGRYITQMKIGYAKLLLQDPDTSVTYAAEASGFANANYFAKVFRKETGMSPSEYLAGALPRSSSGQSRSMERGPELW